MKKLSFLFLAAAIGFLLPGGCSKSSTSTNNNNNSNNNTGNSTPPTIVSVNPSLGEIGSIDTIRGTNFSTISAEDTVTFNGVRATIQSATSTQLIVSVPAGASTGKLKVVTKGGPVTGPTFIVIESGFITTVAGTGDNNSSGDNGPATAAALKTPTGMAIDSAGNIFFCEVNGHRVRKISTTGIITTIAGNGTEGYSGDGGPAVNATLRYPNFVKVDRAGNIYISDGLNHVIRKINTSGIITTMAGNGTPGFSGDNGPATSAQLNGPEDILIDSYGNIYIVDQSNFRIRMVNTSGIITTIAGNGVYGYSGDGGSATAADIGSPIGIAMDNSGNIYFTGNSRIRKINASGIISTIANSQGVEGYGGEGGQAIDAQLKYPTGILTDNTGNLYFAENYFNHVLKIDASGILTSIAGTDFTGNFSGDNGPATSAQLNGPYDLAFDGKGNMYFTDMKNGRIRKITR